MWRPLLSLFLTGANVALAGCGAPDAPGVQDASVDSDAKAREAAPLGPTHARRVATLTDPYPTAAGATASASASAPSLPRRPPRPMRVRKDGFLPDEHVFLAHATGALAGEKAGLVLKSEDFDDFVRSMQESMATDRDAADLAQFYGEQIGRQLPGNSALGELACGMSVCIGSMRDSAAGRAGDAWAQQFSRSPDTPHYSFIYAQVPLGNRNVETRFVIGTDPAFGGITIPAPRPGRD
jgi:hypothetical protein